MASDLFAPPTTDEMKSAQSLRMQTPADVFAPPSKEEMAGAPQTATDLKGQALLDYMRSGGDQSERNRAPLGQVVGAAKNIADYPAGLVRTGLAEAGGLVTGKPNLVTEGDVKNAFLGNAPKSSEYMERAGVPKGPSVTLPYLGDTSARDVLGFGADVATDPLTFAAGKGFANPVGEATEAAGKSTYKSGFKKIDERLAEKGKTPLSDLLLEKGAPTGTTKTIADKAEQLAEDAGTKRQALYDQTSAKGASLDLAHPLPKAEAAVKEMADSPALEDSAGKLQSLLDKFKAKGKVDVSTASKWKSQLYDALPESAFGPHGEVKGPYKKFVSALASDLKEGIEGAAEKASPGAGEQIAKTNDEMGTLLSARKPLDMQVRRGNTPNTFSSVDAILTHEPHILAVKKAADIAKTTYARTKVGKGLMNAGRSGVAQGLMNRGLLNKRKQQGLIDEGSPGEQLLQTEGEP